MLAINALWLSFIGVSKFLSFQIFEDVKSAHCAYLGGREISVLRQNTCAGMKPVNPGVEFQTRASLHKIAKEAPQNKAPLERYEEMLTFSLASWTQIDSCM